MLVIAFAISPSLGSRSQLPRSVPCNTRGSFSGRPRRWPSCSLSLLPAFGLQKPKPVQDLHNSSRQRRICHRAVRDEWPNEQRKQPRGCYRSGASPSFLEGSRVCIVNNHKLTSWLRGKRSESIEEIKYCACEWPVTNRTVQEILGHKKILPS